MIQYLRPPCSNSSSGSSALKYVSTYDESSPRLLTQAPTMGRNRPDNGRLRPVKFAVVVNHSFRPASSASSFCERAAPPRILASVEFAYADSLVSSGSDCAAAMQAIDNRIKPPENLVNALHMASHHNQLSV